MGEQVERLAALQRRIEALLEDLDGRAAIVVKDLAGESFLQLNADAGFLSASLIKVPILWHFLKEVHAGRLDRHELITVPPAAVVGGSGVVAALEPGVTLRLTDLAVLMTIVSDNTATNLLIDRLGLKPLAATIDELGLAQTRLQRKMMDYDSRARGLENVTSAADMVQLFTRVLAADGLPAAAADEMLSILKRQQDRQKIPALLPEETIMAHKTGELEGVEHDAGILFVGERPVIVAVLTAELADNRMGIGFAQQVGLAVYEAFS